MVSINYLDWLAMSEDEKQAYIDERIVKGEHSDVDEKAVYELYFKINDMILEERNASNEYSAYSALFKHLGSIGCVGALDQASADEYRHSQMLVQLKDYIEDAFPQVKERRL